MNITRRIALSIIAVLMLAMAPAFALEADYIPMSVTFPLASTDAGSETTSIHTFVAPENITIKSVYVTETDGVTANATDSATFSVKDDGSAVQTYTTNVSNLTAMTPVAFTLVTTSNAHRIAKGSVVTVAVSKNGSGVALTTPIVQINYVVGW